MMNLISIEPLHCSRGACALRSGTGVGLWLTVLLPPGCALCLREFLPAWGFMWAMAFGIFLSCKWLTLSTARQPRLHINSWRKVGYLFGWPGMDPGRFLQQGVPVTKPSAVEWCAALGKTLLGAALIWGLARCLPGRWSLAAGWVGWIGLAFLLHFGLFHLLALVWQRLGRNAQPIMQAPIRSTSLGEFWGKRWNAAFHQLAHTYTFKPLRPLIGLKGATLVAFLISGLVHELVISLPARGGYGLPTGYFLFQGLGLVFERSKLGRRLGLGRGLRGWFFTVFCTAGPAVGLFHPHFIHNVVLPFLHEIGAT